MKKSAHLVDVPVIPTILNPSTMMNLENLFYLQTYAVQVNARNRNQHLIQLPVSVNLEKVRKPMECCPTILLKIDTGADVNLLNCTTFDWVIGNRSILQPSRLKMKNYSSSRIVVLGKILWIVRWKGKNLQATLLCDNSQYLTQSAVQRCMLHLRSGETMLHSGRREIKSTCRSAKQIYKAHTQQICKQIYRTNT